MSHRHHNPLLLLVTVGPKTAFTVAAVLLLFNPVSIGIALALVDYFITGGSMLRWFGHS
jgi:hypothetical protein